MCVYNFPFQHEVYRSSEINEMLNNFDNYETNVEKIDINDDEAVRSILREIPLDDYQPSKNNSALLESAKRNGETVKQSAVTEDEMIKLIQRLHSKDNSKGVSNLEYMANYKPQSDSVKSKLNAYHALLMADKEKEEKEFYEKIKKQSDENSYYSTCSKNRFLNEIDELK